MSTFLRDVFPIPLIRKVPRDEAISAVIAKPQMRGLLLSSIRRNLVVGFTLSIMSGLAFKVFVADVRKERYAEFYRTLNAEEMFEDMRKKKVFQSC